MLVPNQGRIQNVFEFLKSAIKKTSLLVIHSMHLSSQFVPFEKKTVNFKALVWIKSEIRLNIRTRQYQKIILWYLFDFLRQISFSQSKELNLNCGGPIKNRIKFPKPATSQSLLQSLVQFFSVKSNWSN